MAIKTISELTEVQSAKANDEFLLNTETGAKRIKVSAINNVEKLELTYSEGVVSTVKTAGEIKALYNAGKVFIGSLSPQEGVISQAYVASITLNQPGGLLTLFSINEETVQMLYLEASTDDEPFLVWMG